MPPSLPALAADLRTPPSGQRQIVIRPGEGAMEAVAAIQIIHEADHAAEDEVLAAGSDVTLLITAASGIEVETMARRIHAAGDRARLPFVVVIAAGLPGDPARLTNTCADLVDAANGGTLLVTSVEHLPAAVQSQLIDTLASLQAEREPSNGLRLMAGTTGRLYERVADGTFSAQLFYRLNIIHVDATHRAR